MNLFTWFLNASIVSLLATVLALSFDIVELDLEMSGIDLFNLNETATVTLSGDLTELIKGNQSFQGGSE